MSAAVITDTVRINFRQSKVNLDLNVADNRQAIQRIADSLRTGYADSMLMLRSVQVVGAASPEGSVKFNRWLSEKRAQVLFDYFADSFSVDSDSLSFTFLGRDWRGLKELVLNDEEVPYRDETLVLIDEIISDVDNGKRGTDPVVRLKRLRKGMPYLYMYRNLFPSLRASTLKLTYERMPDPTPVYVEPDTVPVYIEYPDTVEVVEADTTVIGCRPFYMDIRTNMLYDVAALPTLGVEFYLGKNISIGANWTYGWWKTDRHHRYWRAYGGDLNVRWWFGKAAHEKPLTGHHVGLFGQILTYDFEWGGKGYLGGKPGGTLWDKMNWGVGAEYGYSLPIGRRLNIDFTLGVGYLSGEYQEYKPVDNCYVWQATKRRRYFGPTKAEISLVWLIGCDNWNRPKAKKGGDQ